jgi:hypothetical protein
MECATLADDAAYDGSHVSVALYFLFHLWPLRLDAD